MGKEDLKGLGTTFFTSSLLVVVFGLLQVFSKFILPLDFVKQSSFNTIGSVASWGVFITFVLAMIVTVLSYISLSNSWKLALVILGGLIIVALVILNYQFLWFSLALTMLCLVAYKFFSDPTAKAPFALPLAVMVLAIFFIFIGPRPSLVVLPIEIRPNLPSNLAVVKGVWLSKNFLFGTGPATFDYDWMRFRPTEINATNFWGARFNQGFSFMGTILATGGLLGLFAFLFILASFIRQNLNRKQGRTNIWLFLLVWSHC